MTAAEFQAYVGTDTLTYHYSSGVLGTADYGANQTLRWRFPDEPCVTARWQQEGDALCFAFDPVEMSTCWRFYRRDTGIVGTGLGDISGEVIRDIARTSQPLDCADLLAGA
jgi:hypothetical protein